MDPSAFPTVAELWELVTHWQHFATGPPGKREAREDPNAGIMQSAPDTCAGCGKQGQGGMVGEPEIWLGYECGCLPEFTEAQSLGLHFTKAAEWARRRRAA
jgi:hypothetical protein